MRINALRKELAALLDNSGAQRKPALRRSLQEDWLYATDYPALCSGSMPETVMEKLETAGWETAPDGDWMQLRKPAGEPPEDWYEGNFGPEAACCLSLLERHAGTACGAPEAVQRTLIKAGEEGGKAYETACAELHREWAERLRRGEPLPAVSRRYFGE